MSKIEEARKILKDIGMPDAQQSDVCAFTLLALAGINPDTSWKDSGNEWIGIHEILVFTADSYDKKYAENSRETIRKQALQPFRLAAVVEDNGVATNSPKYKYRLTSEMLELIRNCGSEKWPESLVLYCTQQETLKEMYESKKIMQRISVSINSNDYTFSPGKHNELQKAVLDEFATRFAPGSECIYIGDAENKELYKNQERLDELGFDITPHDKMPDVILYSPVEDWIYFIEAVTSVGPMDAKRIFEISSITKNVKSGKIFVTAFPDLQTYKSFLSKLAWETEVWIADAPEHMIHLNGDKFLGPR